MIDITMIRLVKGEKIKIHYRKQNAGDMTLNDEFTVQSWDKPRPELYETITALAPHVCAFCDLPAEYAGGMQVTALSLSYTAETIAVTAHVEKYIVNSQKPFAFSTPPMMLAGSSGRPGACTPEAAKAINEVLKEAALYVNGDRAQVGFDFGGMK